MEIVPARFQSTHPRGVRHTDVVVVTTVTAISIHAPTWGATSSLFHCRATLLFQSTHPRGVRRASVGAGHRERPISIHAPTWVRPQRGHPPPDLVKFQSTHPRGVRRMNKRRRYFYDDFNPRTHVGCDVQDLRSLVGQQISIHAPTWGATPQTLWNWRHGKNFNPRTHVGCDELISIAQNWYY